MERMARCVFADILDSNYQIACKTNDGNCWAQAGNQMNVCCFEVARYLILLGQRELVKATLCKIVGNTLRAKSRRSAIVGALDSLPERQT